MSPKLLSMRIVVLCNIACAEKKPIVGNKSIFGIGTTIAIPAKYGASNVVSQLTHVGLLTNC